MRIGFVALGWEPQTGGVESHTADTARALVARGHTLAALALDTTADTVPFTTRHTMLADVSLTRVAYRWHDHATLLDLVDKPRMEPIVGAWLERERIELLHVQHASGFGIQAIDAARARGVACVVTLHDAWSLCPRGQMFHVDGHACARAEPEACGACLVRTWPWLFEGRTPARDAEERTRTMLGALARADLVLTPSHAARELYARHGIDGVRVLENGVTLRASVPEPPDLTCADGSRPRAATLHVGVLGSVQPSKGVEFLARVVCASDLRDLVLDVHGPLDAYHGDRAHVERLQALAERDPRVRLHGAYAYAELPRVLAGLHAVAAPALWHETFGLGAREAAAAGRFVLASDRGGLASLTGERVQLLPASDAAAWTRALAELPRRIAATRASPVVPPRTVEEAVDELEGLYAALLRTR